MKKAFKDRDAKPQSSAGTSESHEQEAEEITAEYKSRLRRHEMVEFSDLYLTHDDEMRQERGLDW